MTGASDIEIVGSGAPTSCSAVGEAEACYSGQASTRGLGQCADGTRTCQDDGQWSECVGEVLPDDGETCADGLDNDCNGSADEGCACTEGETKSCYSGPGTTQGMGICRDGTQSCVGQVWASQCVGQILPEDAETCDGLDNDCNGSADEGCTCQNGVGRECYTGPTATQGVGVCQGGQQICEDGLWPTTCAGQITPGVESCNGEDDDCDGDVDEGDPGGGGSCDTGSCGVCAEGTRYCSGGSLHCSQDYGSSAESCDGEDNDCDCDTDEGNPGGGGSCTTGLLGVCSAGTRQCQGGSLVCLQNVQPSTEFCDDLDNDCDGSVDENAGQNCFYYTGTCNSSYIGGCDGCDMGCEVNDPDCNGSPCMAACPCLAGYSRWYCDGFNDCTDAACECSGE